MIHRMLLLGLLGAAWASGAEMTVNGRHFILPDGFTIELVAGPPLVQRPITADFDAKGHLYVADSSGSSDKAAKQLELKPHRIVRLTDSHGDGNFDQQTVFADHMMFPEGTMWLDGSLYVAAPPSIWKLTDTTGNGVADSRVEWFDGKTLTGCANDLHGPYAGPDGWIYWCKGAFAEQRYERPGHKPFVTRAAHVFRARPDGSGIEPVMTGGMDNPVEVTFTPGGERIVSSTFLVNPRAGERDGLIHAVYGGIYPKIHDDVTDPHPHTFPELMPIMVSTGPAAECAVTRYEGDAFGEAYRDNLFASSFNLHKVTRHVLTPEGATFKSQDSDFVVSDNIDFHPTHLLEDADGSLLIVDTGGWYKLCCPTSQLGKPNVMGAIYRVKRVGSKTVEDPRGLKLTWDVMPDGELCGLLSDSRFIVRRTVTAMIAKRGAGGVKSLTAFLAEKPSALARVNAVWALTRIDAPAAREACRGMLKDPDETVRQAAGHSVALWRDRDAVPGLVELLHNESPQNRRVAAEALGRIGDKAAVPELLMALRHPGDHFLYHSLTYALIEIADGEGTAPGLSSPDPHVRRATMMALDQMEPRGPLSAAAVATQLSSETAEVRDTAAWIAARHLDWGDALAETIGDWLKKKLTDDDRTAISHQLAKLSKSPAIQRLVVDLLDGPECQVAFDSIGASGQNPLPERWIAGLVEALEDRHRLGAAARMLRKLPPEAVAPLADALRKAGDRADVSDEARVDALGAAPPLREVSPETFAFLVAQVAPAQPAMRRSLAADVLGRATLSNNQLAALTDQLQIAGPIEINKLIRAYGKARDESLGLKVVAALRQSKSLRSLRMDVLKPRIDNFGPEVAREAETLWATLNPDAAQQKARLDQMQATLPTGDVEHGRDVFNSAKASCVTCHSIGYGGGHVGPDLTRVGSIRAERDLLESILYPSASFAQSFEPYIAITTTGQRYDGILRRNDADGVTLVTGPDQETKIARAELKELRPGTLSIMPAGLDQQLSPQEMADLVAFLKACK